MFDGMHNIFKVTAGYNSTYHHRMGWVVGGHLFSLSSKNFFVMSFSALHNDKLRRIRRPRLAVMISIFYRIPTESGI